MNIIEAVKEAREGNKIRRKNWHHTHYIFCYKNTPLMFNRFEKEFVFDIKKPYSRYLEAEEQHRKYQNEEDKILEKATYVSDWQVTLYSEDYIADDWEVVE